ncbi:MAG: DUF72 domain-containing protein, partial [Planctomycetota bacterium]|nr:DUF72 domain-containing protein [Planctomycetota bacterium]
MGRGKKRRDEQGMLFDDMDGEPACCGRQADGRHGGRSEGPPAAAGSGVTEAWIGRDGAAGRPGTTGPAAGTRDTGGWVVGPCLIGGTPVYTGTSGYSFRDWTGPFYPAGLRRDGQLSFYAGRFPAVEINSTYYHIPSRATMEQMLRRTPDSFRFAVKCYKGITHEEGEIGVFEKFVESLRPISEAGRLGAVLAQFPQRFKNSSASRDRLAELARSLSGLPVVVEFRDRSWAIPSTVNLLRSLGLGLCCVDEPDLPELFPRMVEATSSVGYLRFHSRNAAKWYAGGAERYDYDYSDAELGEWVEKMARIAPKVSVIYIFFNNCTAA